MLWSYNAVIVTAQTFTSLAVHQKLEKKGKNHSPSSCGIHSFILETCIAPLQETTTQRRSRTKKDLREM